MFIKEKQLNYSKKIAVEAVSYTHLFGGLTVEQSSEINAEVFLIEDPVAEDNDRLLKDKNNIRCV